MLKLAIRNWRTDSARLLRQLEIVVGAALGVGVAGDQERIVGKPRVGQGAAERAQDGGGLGRDLADL